MRLDLGLLYYSDNKVIHMILYSSSFDCTTTRRTAVGGLGLLCRLGYGFPEA